MKVKKASSESSSSSLGLLSIIFPEEGGDVVDLKFGAAILAGSVSKSFPTFMKFFGVFLMSSVFSLFS